MTKREYAEEMCQRLRSFLPEFSLRVVQTLKVNDTVCIGIELECRNDMQLFYVDHFYESGTEITEKLLSCIAKQIINYGVQDREQYMMEYMDYDKVKDRLVIRMMSKELNKKFLKNKVTFPACGGLCSVIGIMEKKDKENSFTSVGVTFQMIERWGISQWQLYKEAWQCMKKRQYRFFDMNQFALNMLLNKDSSCDYDIFYNPERVEVPLAQMYILTYEDKQYGASALADGDALRKIRDILKQDYYILPSSVHEVLVVPAELYYNQPASKTIELLEDMVKSVNSDRNAISLTDLLTNEVFHYSSGYGIEASKEYLSRVAETQDNIVS